MFGIYSLKKFEICLNLFADHYVLDWTIIIHKSHECY